MAKSPEEMLESMVANLREKTGRPLEEWIVLARAGGEKHGEMVKHLKTKHGLSHGYANLVALRTLAAADGGPKSGADLVAEQYSGARAGLRPIHDALISAAKKFGADVEIAPKKTCVSLRRARQFALIQPATNTRVDLGLKLDGTAFRGRLEKWPNPMCTHRVRLESVAAVDRELVAWMKQSYTQAG